MTTQRNPIYEGALTIEDIKPGRRVARIYPHIGNEPSYYTLVSGPFMRSRDATCSDPIPGVKLIREGGSGIVFEAYLSDMGVVPRDSGAWSTNFVVWRSHGCFAGRYVENSPRVISARADYLIRRDEYRRDDGMWGDLVHGW